MRDREGERAGDRTVTVTASGAETEARPVGPVPLHVGSQADFPERYEILRELGRGGMGVVELARDRHTAREVALKRLLPEGRDRAVDTDRFLREVRTQAQLEHPAVVPVYDVGTDDRGDPYFTMKRIGGTTLRALFEGLRRGDRDLEARFPRERRLEIVARVADAVGFAHSRGVLHRDLKPSNVMVGQEGEVYVLDWGVAGSAASGAAGTRAYAAPEQLAGGDGHRFGAEMDVWGLGQLLHESLVLDRARVERADPDGCLRPSLVSDFARPIPPELDELCAEALAVAPDRRLASAAAFRQRLRDFLNQQRDADLRRRFADRHLSAARSALEEDGAGLEGRRRGLAELGRALALAPGTREPLLLMARCLGDPPSAEPASVRARLDERYRQEVRLALFVSFLVVLPSIAALSAIMIGDQVLDPLRAGMLLGGISVAGGVGLYGARPSGGRLPEQIIYIVLSGINFFLASQLLSPFAILPTLTLGLAAIVGGIREVRVRNGLLVFLALAFLASVAAPALGWVQSTYHFDDGVLWLTPRLVTTERGPMMLGVMATTFTAFGCVAIVFLVRERLEMLHGMDATTRWQLLRVVGGRDGVPRRGPDEELP